MSDDLVRRAEIKASMLVMGEPIAYGSDAEIIGELVARIRELEAKVAALQEGQGVTLDPPWTPIRAGCSTTVTPAPLSVGKGYLRDAFIAGATAVHDEWAEQHEAGGYPPREADFYEAADDYATAVHPAPVSVGAAQVLLDETSDASELDEVILNAAEAAAATDGDHSDGRLFQFRAVLRALAGKEDTP